MCHAYFAGQRCEAEHLHCEGPGAISQFREGELAVLVGGGPHLLVGLCSRDGNAWNR